MPLVFVHGIGNRPGLRSEAVATARDELFERFLFPIIGAQPGVDVVHCPVWGPLAGALRYHGVSQVTDDLEALGGADGDDLRDEVAATEDTAEPDRIVHRVARRDLTAAVDLLFGLPPAEGWSPAAADAAARMVAYSRHRQALQPQLSEVDRHPWLADVRDDDELVDALLDHAARWRLSPSFEPVPIEPPATPEAMGGGAGTVRDWLGSGLRQLRHYVVGAPVTALASAGRRATSRIVTETAGDVLTYLVQRGDRDAPGPIVEAVTAELDRAVADRRPEQPLVVVTHSMGGNIMYDILSHFRTDLTVDVLVTVGSQVGLFAELGLFRSSAPAAASDGRWDPIVRPGNVSKWINVVDRADVLGYRIAPIVTGTTDYHYPTDALWAHSAYFRQPHFHLRLAERVREARP